MRTITKSGLALFLVGVTSLGIASEAVETRKVGVARDAQSVAAGSTLEVVLPCDFASVRGYHRASAVEARFVPTSGDPTPLAARAVKARTTPEGLRLDPRAGDPFWSLELVEAAAEVEIPATLANSAGRVEVEAVVEAPAVERATGLLLPSTHTARASVEVDVDVAEADRAAARAERFGNKPWWLELWLAASAIATLVGVSLVLTGWIGPRNFFGSMLLMGVSTALLQGIWGNELERQEGSPRRRGVAPGASVTVQPDVDTAAVDRYHDVLATRAFLVAPGRDQIELAARSVGDKTWKDPIAVAYVRKGPVFKTNRFEIKPKIEVEVPPAGAVEPGEYELVVSGLFKYPHVNALEIVAGAAFEYEERTKTFKERQRLVVSDGAPTEDSGGDGPPWPVVLLQLAISVGGIWFVGALLLALKRALF